MPTRSAAPFATFLIVGPTCFFLGILFANFPYDYNVLWTTPAASPENPTADPRMPYFLLQENHLRFLYDAPPLINRILHIVVVVGLLGFMMKLYKPSEANMLFDGASLVLYMCGIVVYAANIIKGLRMVSTGLYGADAAAAAAALDGDDRGTSPESGGFVGREDSLRVLSASNTILALVLVGVLVLQAGQWYAQRKEAEELDQMDRVRDEKKALKAKELASGGGGNSSSKKRQ